MNKKALLLTFCLVSIFGCLTAMGQPKVHKYTFDTSAIVQKMSNNGKWGVAQACYDDAIDAGVPRLINIDTDEVIEMQTAEDIETNGVARVKDVTDDGNTAVGSYKGQPAYWLKMINTWFELPLPAGCSSGVVHAITPDGKYAVGECFFDNNIYTFRGAMWNLMKGTVMELSNVPQLDMTHTDQNQMRFVDLSPDARYILMYMSPSYLEECCVWVYDRETATAKAIGFTPSDTERWTPKFEDLIFVEEPAMSANGKYVSVNIVSTDDNYATYEYPAVYNVETDEMTVYNEMESDGLLTLAVDNNGNLYAGSPGKGSPIRNWSVRCDGYWFDIASVLRQVYGYDLNEKANVDNTGSVFSVSDDCKRFVVMTDPQYDEGYVLDLPESLDVLCKSVNLLGDYTVSPVEGANISSLRSFEVLFERNVKVLGSASQIVRTKVSTGETLSPMTVIVDETDKRNVLISFRGRDAALDAGEEYTFFIPAGMFCVDGDEERTNDAITITYKGRGNAAVAVTKIYPEDGSEIARIDNQSSNITINFDTNVAVAEDASATLLNITDNTTTKLNLLAVDNKVAVYPSSQVNLYNGLEYKVTIPANSITDLTGGGGNAEIVINYTGTYEPEIKTDDENVFIETFDNPSVAYNTLMRYEGDNLIPDSDMKEWGFNDEYSYPWIFNLLESTTSTDYFAGSHSSYDPAGRSDDWMSTPQLYLPDDYCNLSFKAQSYHFRKSDSLKVVILQSDSVMYSLNTNAINKFKTEGKVVLKELLSNGGDNEATTGEWTDYRVDLAEYGGKYIYIAFWNNNEDQSAIFVDSIVVKRNLKFLIGLQNEESVVNKENVVIKGRVTANDDVEVFNSLLVELYDEDGNKVDEFSQNDLNLAKGQYVNFEFANPLPLKAGVINNFVVKVKLDDYTSETKGSVKNLMFATTKRVVIEEKTGTTCGYCPRGILAMENLENLYRDLVIPVVIHTYEGDKFNTGQDDYSNYLGLLAAPSAMVQRSGIVSDPIGYDYFTFEATFSNGYNLWADYVAQELQTPADANISASVTIDEENEKYSVPVTVTPAMHQKNLNLNLFLVILEDGLIGAQTNYVGAETDPIFGDWGAGGRYSEANNPGIVYNDVVRSTMSSFEGFSGYLPQTMTANTDYEAVLGPYDLPSTVNNLNKAKAVVMLIDANDGSLINAAVTKFPGYETGINGVRSDEPQHAIGFVDGNLMVVGEGPAAVQVYSTSGMLLGAASGNGSFNVPTSQYNGTVIVKVTSAGKTIVKKFLVGR